MLALIGGCSATETALSRCGGDIERVSTHERARVCRHIGGTLGVHFCCESTDTGDEIACSGDYDTAHAACVDYLRGQK